MNVLDILAQHGFTIGILQGIIIGGVILTIIGFYWHYILAGAAILFSIYVLATPANEINQVSTAKPIEHIETQEERWHREFMEDCTSIAANSKQTCDDLWTEREADEKQLAEEKVEAQPASYKIKGNKV